MFQLPGSSSVFLLCGASGKKIRKFFQKSGCSNDVMPSSRFFVHTGAYAVSVNLKCNTDKCAWPASINGLPEISVQAISELPA